VRQPSTLVSCSVVISLVVIFSLLSGCSELKGPSNAEQVERTIRQEIQRNERGLNALTEVAQNTEYDGFAWRRGERIQVRQRNDQGMQLLEDAEAPAIIATAVEYNIPSFSIVRYQQGWLVVFRNYVSDHCQAVYAYAYRGTLSDTPQCSDELYAQAANGQCQSPINEQWVVFKEWFFAETLADEGNPVCLQKVAEGWQAVRNN